DAFGYQAAYSNTTGINNVALGYNTLYNNSTGNYNVAVGTNALASAASTNISTNTAVGYNAATAVTGNDNTAVGVSALQTATTSTKNSALGAYCLQNASTGNGQHCGFGFAALYNTSTGTNNSGFGYYAGASNTTGNHITCIGSGADVGAVGLANATAIGSSAITTANQMMYMGSSTALLYCAAGLWTGSDSRFKTNVQENVKGLSFIKKLRPVTYNLDTKTMDDFLVQNMSDSIKAIHKAGMDFTSSSSVIHAGFIAQEVETAASAAGFNSSIVHAPDNSSTHYALNYSEIVVPLVKAVQELSRTSDSLTVVTHKQDSIIRKQDSINSSLQSQINRIVSSCCPISAGHQMQGNNSGNNNSPNNSTGVISTELSDVNSIVLNQNAPNPFAEQTLITYNVPVINGSAQILFYNSNGVMIKSVDIKNAGQGQLNVYANDLSNGTYSYTLIVDGKIIDTKKMIKQQ
ncbi:MAG TPA: tail fiber domain-containing protein, partial [Bacteroidia bacterium]|nr:tail fiber domain-containing protein [Bacteroidia bacterium]